MKSCFFCTNDFENKAKKYLAYDLRRVYKLLLFFAFCLISEMSYAVEIGCAGPNRNPAACSLEECYARQANKNTMCNQPRSCGGISGCAELQRRLGVNQSCLAAREFVGACFFVSDPGHDAAISQVRSAIATCNSRIALPEPVGCADPCP